MPLTHAKRDNSVLVKKQVGANSSFSPSVSSAMRNNAAQEHQKSLPQSYGVASSSGTAQLSPRKLVTLSQSGTE